MKTLPQSLSTFSAPDADTRQFIEQVRRNLMLTGDPNWQRYTDQDILDHAAVPYVPPAYVNQPKPPGVIREISTQELMHIIQTRERFPGYRSDINITPEIRAKVIAKANQEISSVQGDFGNQPFTVVPSYKGPDVAIPDPLALSALKHSKMEILLPVTDFAPSKTSTEQTIMNKRYNDRHPVAFNESPDFLMRSNRHGRYSSRYVPRNINRAVVTGEFATLVEPIGSLDSFSAFAETAVGANWLTGLTNTANAAAGIYGQVKAADLAKTTAKTNLASLNLQSQMLAAQQAQADQKKDTNWLPIAAIGGGVLLLVVLLAAKK
jgi:hypothetical protein